MDPLDRVFAEVFLALGLFTILLALAMILAPDRLSRGKSADEVRLIAAGLVLVGLGALLRVPIIAFSALGTERGMVKALILIALLVTLGGAGLELGAVLRMRRRSATSGEPETRS